LGLIRSFRDLRGLRGADKLVSYESFERALADSNSYEDPRLIEVVREKTKLYRTALVTSQRTIASRQTAQNMFVLAHVEPQRAIDVLEVGGACGASYFEIKHLLPNRIAHWAITETPAMAAAGDKINDNGDPNLSFHSDLTAAAKQLQSRDLAIAQGVLQYAAAPVGAAQGFVRASVLLRLHHANGGRRRRLANVHNSRHGTRRARPGPFAKRTGRQIYSTDDVGELRLLLSTVPANYEIVFKFAESEDRVMAIDDRRVTARDAGFLARLQAH
jgi:hypothetical protein